MIDWFVMYFIGSVGLGCLYGALCWHDITPGAGKLHQQQPADQHAEWLRPFLPSRVVIDHHHEERF